MVVILGLVVLVAAVVIGVAGVLTNQGSVHAVTYRFAVFGYHVNGSTGRLFLYGIVVGAVAVFGLSLLLVGARRTARRGSTARQGLQQSRGETAAARADRDDLLNQRVADRAFAVSTPPHGLRDGDDHRDAVAGKRGLLHPLRNGDAPPEATAASPQSADQPARF